ncbi:hypothetical protein DV735_g3780, partial [Chaetothyriales sp. CBS 134920]
MTKDEACPPQRRINTLSELDQQGGDNADTVGERWYDTGDISPLPTPVDEHVELPAKAAPHKSPPTTTSKTLQDGMMQPDQARTTRVRSLSHSHSHDEERMPTWIPGRTALRVP